MPRTQVAGLMIRSLSEALLAARTALEYLTADPAYAELAPWRGVYEAHLARLYTLGLAAGLRATPGAGGHAPAAGKAAEAAEGLPRLLVVTGDEAMRVDLAALRAAARTGGFTWQRLVAPTADELAHELNRARRLRNPYRWLHLGMHADREGLQFADRCVDGEWLSRHLRQVDVLLLAACRCDWIADQLGIVPWVISFAEEIETDAAAIFSGAFWTAMGQHQGAEAAVAAALGAAPPEVAEFVRRHW